MLFIFAAIDNNERLLGATLLLVAIPSIIAGVRSISHGSVSAYGYGMKDHQGQDAYESNKNPLDFWLTVSVLLSAGILIGAIGVFLLVR